MEDALKTIVQLSTYQFQDPKQGGELRCHSFAKYLGDVHRVVPFLVMPGAKTEKTEIAGVLAWTFAPADLADFGGGGFTNDIAIAQYLSAHPEVAKDLAQELVAVDPDAILLEHPYLWPVANAYRQSFAKKPVKIIYDGHNIEWRMKSTYLHACLPGELAEKLLRWLKDFEKSVVQNADAVISVSVQDAEEMKKWRRGRSQPRVIRNGTRTPARPSHELLEKWKQKLESESRVILTYVASAHPPNIRSFLRLFPLGYLNPFHTRVVLVGGAGWPIATSSEHQANQGLHSNLVTWTGPVENADLDAILSLSDCLLLPIHEGGGTNLKTAEALVSGRPILATPKAFLGFEDFQKSEGVVISSTLEDFKMKAASLTKKNRPSVERPGAHEKLTWEGLLTPQDRDWFESIWA